MNPKIPYSLFIFLLIFIGLLHFAGIFFYFYWRVPLYDSVVHVFSSVWVILLLMSVLFPSETFKTGSRFALIIVLSAIIGIGWELVEVRAGVTSIHDMGYWADSVGDLISDIIGGLIVFIYTLWPVKK
jgi:hypothetical protein